MVGGRHEHLEFTSGYVELRRLWDAKEGSLLRKSDVQAQAIDTNLGSFA